MPNAGTVSTRQMAVRATITGDSPQAHQDSMIDTAQDFTFLPFVAHRIRELSPLLSLPQNLGSYWLGEGPGSPD